MKNKRYVFSYDGEYWYDETHFTSEQALEYAKKHWREHNHEFDLIDGYLDIHIGEAEYYKDSLDADDIIKRQQEIAWDNSGEYAETYLDDITKEEKAILSERLNKVWYEFIKEFNHEANFYTVANEKKYEFNIYSEAFKEYYKEED